MLRVQQGYYPASVMAWWGVIYDGMWLHFCEKSVKPYVQNYQMNILEKIVKSPNNILFGSL